VTYTHFPPYLKCTDKLCELENEYTSHKLILFAIFMPKIFTVGSVGGNLTKVLTKIILHSFFETPCI